jgi:hypothetical protein
VTFIGGTVTFIGEAVIFIKGTVTFIDRAVMSIGGAIIFIGKRSLAIKKLFKIAEVKVVNNIKINKYNLRR